MHQSHAQMDRLMTLQAGTQTSPRAEGLGHVHGAWDNIVRVWGRT
jgi:hypothetical protein